MKKSFKLLLATGLVGISFATTTVYMNTSTPNAPIAYAMSKQAKINKAVSIIKIIMRVKLTFTMTKKMMLLLSNQLLRTSKKQLLPC